MILYSKGGIKMKKYEASFESLYTHEYPDWFRDAKFGIWSHWGPQSVPMCGDWYARNMYIENSEQYRYHCRHYGHPSVFGYKDICKLWKAEKFDPDRLMELYYSAGARYFVAQATHHDNFFNYDSRVNPMNSVNVGPKKDILAMWKSAADRFNMPFGVTEHLGASFWWWSVNKGCDREGPYAGVPYDGNDPEYRSFYHDNYEHLGDTTWKWLTENEGFMKYWSDSMNELIDRFQPELLYSDSVLPFNYGHYQPGLEAVARLYNRSAEKHGSNQAVYTQKDRNPDIYRAGVLDIEKSQLPGIMEHPWQTDTCIGNWFYDAKQDYKKPAHIIEMLIDIVSKNGTMLLNVLQKPDGTIDEWEEHILKELGGWFEVCHEGIYGTRPFRVFSEGDTRATINGFEESKTSWSSSDYRFTTKNGCLYAFMMCSPESGVAVIKSLNESERVKEVSLLGCGGLEFNQSFGVLSVRLPERLPTKYTNCLKISFH